MASDEMQALQREYEEHIRDLEEEGVIFKNVEYEYMDKNKSFDLTIIPYKQIATVTEKIPLDDGTFELNILSDGIDYDEVCRYFPPVPAMKKRGYEYNMLGLFRSVLYEMYQTVQNSGEQRKEGNVRGVWYSHFIHIVESVLGLGETDSVKNAINTAWGDLVNSGTFAYEDLSIVSAKENVRKSHVRDSPYNNLIVAVEKEDLFDGFQWIPKLFNCTLIAAGGQPSRAVARAFIQQLRDEGVDLDQQFHMCTVSDCDPAGYYIQDSFCYQLEKAIEYYGGNGKLDIHRIFVRRDQVTTRLLDHDGVPCVDTKAKSEASLKAETTKWEHFCNITNGGLYKDPPARWDGPRYVVNTACPSCGYTVLSIDVTTAFECPKCEHTVAANTLPGDIKCRAKLELNAFGKNNIELKIIQEILQLIEDHSKIMIPEIMRVFNQLKMDVALARYEELEEHQIDPIIDQYLEAIDNLYHQYWSELDSAEDSANSKFEDDIEDIRDTFEQKVEEIRDDIDDIVRPEMGVFCTLTDLIEKLIRMRNHVEDHMFDQVDSELEDISDLEDQYSDDISPYRDERDEEIKRLEKMRDMYEAEKDKFRNECATVFGPAKEQLKYKVLTTYDLEVDVRFREVEMDDRTQPHIARLLTDPDNLIDSSVSAFEHDAPAFKDDVSLRKAAEAREDNISKFRDAFTPEFEGDMQKIIKEKAEHIQFHVKEELLDVAEIDEDRLEEFDQETRDKIKEEHGEL